MLSNIWSLIDNKLFQHSVSTIMISIHSIPIQFVSSRALHRDTKANLMDIGLEQNGTWTPTFYMHLLCPEISFVTLKLPTLHRAPGAPGAGAECGHWHLTSWHSPILWRGCDVGGPGPAELLSSWLSSRDGSIFTLSLTHQELSCHSCSGWWSEITLLKLQTIWTSHLFLLPVLYVIFSRC